MFYSYNNEDNLYDQVYRQLCLPLPVLIPTPPRLGQCLFLNTMMMPHFSPDLEV